MSIKNKRSGFEERCGSLLEPVGFLYEPYQIDYKIKHKYTPDFTMGNILVECKGYFRPGDRQKYKAIRDSLEGTNDELVFLLQAANKRVQKGSILTMGGWCNKERLNWFTYDNIGELVQYALGE